MLKYFLQLYVLYNIRLPHRRVLQKGRALRRALFGVSGTPRQVFFQ